MARRKGEEWFIGSITNNEARTLPVDLSFLPAGKDYVAEIYTDGDKLEDCGHMLNMEQPKAFNAALREFLKQ